MTENSTASGATAGSTQQVSLPTFTSNVPPPGRLELKGKLSDNWKKWKQVWDAYEIVTKLNEKRKQISRSDLHHVHWRRSARSTQRFAVSLGG